MKRVVVARREPPYIIPSGLTGAFVPVGGLSTALCALVGWLAVSLKSMLITRGVSGRGRIWSGW
jgi:hypothetical protein